MQEKNGSANSVKIAFSKYYNSILGKVIYVLFLLLMVIALSQKCNYHIDEILTYGLSNQNCMLDFNVLEGEKYEPAEKPFLGFLTVQPGHQFDYANVWFNQSHDVHPPLYYVLIHTICSFFPKHFSPWFAGAVNFSFALLTLLVLQKLSRYFLDSSFLINIISLAFALSAGILSSTTFLRMYVAAMFWVALMAYCYIKKINGGYNREKDFLLITSSVTLLGVLTHYYCMLYAILLSLTYSVYLVMGKKYKEIRIFCLTMIDTGIILYVIFPPIIQHIFFSYRGQEVLTNAKTISDFYVRLKYFFGFINQQLFGDFGTILLFFIVLLILYLRTNRKKTKLWLYNYVENRRFISYIFLCLPAFLYFVIVSKITVFIAERYLFPIYAVTFWAVFLLLINLLNGFLPSKKLNMVLILIVCLVTVGSWINCRWEYLYLDSKVFLEKLDNYLPVDCVSISSNNGATLLLYVEAKKYRSIQFINAKNKKMIEKAAIEISDNENKDNKVILSLAGIPSDRHKKYIADFLKKTGRFNSFKELGTYWFSTSYVLY